MRGKRLLLATAGVLVAAALAGGIAWATIPDSGVYTACMLNGVGTIRLIDKSLPSTNLMSHCTDKETGISWNQQGQQGIQGIQGPAGKDGAPGKDGLNGTDGTNGKDGKDGVSVTSTVELAGSNCAGGGIQLSAVSGVNYVCNGRDGVAGKDGTDGTNGIDGKDGKDGVSVTSAALPAGDANCANGGSKFVTANNNITYACNGVPGSSSNPHECDVDLYVLNQHLLPFTSRNPDVSGCDVVNVTTTAPGGFVSAIDGLDGGTNGQRVTITWSGVYPATLHVDRAGTLKLTHVDQALNPYDTLELIKAGGYWLEISTSSNCC